MDVVAIFLLIFEACVHVLFVIKVTIVYFNLQWTYWSPTYVDFKTHKNLTNYEHILQPLLHTHGSRVFFLCPRLTKHILNKDK